MVLATEVGGSHYLTQQTLGSYHREVSGSHYLTQQTLGSCHRGEWITLPHPTDTWFLPQSTTNLKYYRVNKKKAGSLISNLMALCA